MNTNQRGKGMDRGSIRLINIDDAARAIIDDILRRYPKRGITWTGRFRWSEQHQKDVMDITIEAHAEAIADIQKHEKLKGHIVPPQTMPTIRQNGKLH